MSPAKSDGPTDEVSIGFNRLMGHFDVPMILVTTVGADGEKSGCLVGFSTQCSIDPARFLVCLSDKNHTYRVAQTADVLAVHVIPKERLDLADLFGSETGDEVDKFAKCEWREGPGGVPLINGCPDWFVGRIREWLDAGDHAPAILDPIAVSDHVPSGALLRLSDLDEVEPGHEA